MEPLLFKNDSSNISITILHENTSRVNVKRNSTFGELKAIYCQMEGLHQSTVMFFKDGVRLRDKEIISSILNGSVEEIDVFKHVSGGGPSKTKIISEKDVLEILDKLSDSEVESLDEVDKENNINISNSDKNIDEESDMDMSKNYRNEDKKENETLDKKNNEEFKSGELQPTSCYDTNILDSQSSTSEHWIEKVSTNSKSQLQNPVCVVIKERISLNEQDPSFPLTKLNYHVKEKSADLESRNVYDDPTQIVPSPTKEELKTQNMLLKEKIKYMEKNVFSKPRKLKKLVKTKSGEPLPISLIYCKISNCMRSFQTVFGLHRHQKHDHNEIKIDKSIKKECPFCGKMAIYIDQHIRKQHKDISTNYKCEVCRNQIITDMNKHRSVCINCPFCSYTNPKKARLLHHIKSRHSIFDDTQSKPLDLTSPLKIRPNIAEEVIPIPDEDIKIVDSDPKHNTENVLENTTIKNCKSVLLLNNKDFSQGGIKQNAVSAQTDLINSKRCKYPFDIGNVDEPYMSEFEENDSVEFTTKRRPVKDEVEIGLREVDLLEPENQKGNYEVLGEFNTFMKNKTNPKCETEKSPYQKDVSTVGMYTRAIKLYLLPAFHRLFDPFDASWLIDCDTPKDCTFEGSQRSFVDNKEPIYITSKVVKEALQISKDYGGDKSGQRGTILSAIVQFMDFVELFFNERLNIYGNGPFKKVITYHKGVRRFIKATGKWKTCNTEKDEAQTKNKIREEYEHPNKERDILEKYKGYVTSKERIDKVVKLTAIADSDTCPSNSEITEMGKFVMGEIVASSGCRPIVVYHMPLGPYIDRKEGFNHLEFTNDECTEEETGVSDSINRLVNPNLPPKERACVHQTDNKTARCPVMCEDEYEPDGYNVRVTWNKNKEESYLHLAKPINKLVGMYDLIRSKYFKGRKSPLTSNPDWLDNDQTPLFLNSACMPFVFLDLKHISDVVGIDISGYAFRRNVSTWAQSHQSKEIRNAEAECLQHSEQVARDSYRLNKQIKPQILTQRYVNEKNLFPDSFCEQLDKKEVKTSNLIKKKEKIRIQKRIDNLSIEKNKYKIVQRKNKPLGPRHRILLSDTHNFIKLMEEVSDLKYKKNLRQIKPAQFRNYIIREVCTAEGIVGSDLRSLWKKVYQGDLIWGVRDARIRAKENGWNVKDNNKTGRDRNSWICQSLRTSCLIELKRENNV